MGGEFVGVQFIEPVLGLMNQAPTIGEVKILVYLSTHNSGITENCEFLLTLFIFLI